MKTAAIILAAALSLGFNQAANADAGKVNLGEPSVGGFPEYLFIEKAPEADAPGVAKLLARAIIVGRVVIFRHLGKLHDAKIGDKGFTPEYFEKAWKEAMEEELFDLTAAQKSAFDKLLWASRVVIDANQDRLNMKGVAFKYFLPASWSREMSVIYKAKTGIVIKQPALVYRNTYDIPDKDELAALTKTRADGYDGKGFGHASTMGKQNIYRHYEPVPVEKGCLGCHGDPKGKLDPLGFEKEGQKLGEIRAVVSVAVPIQ